MVERKDPRNVAVIGSDEPDAIAAARYVEDDFRIRSGLCPNGHGLLEPTSYGQRCPKCHFFCNTKAEQVTAQ
jgi:hypothetical protein